MANAQEISERVNSFLSEKLSLDDFEDWSAEYSWNIHKRADAKTQQLAYLIQSKISQFGDGDLDEASLRKELANAIRPFVPGEVKSNANPISWKSLSEEWIKFVSIGSQWSRFEVSGE